MPAWLTYRQTDCALLTCQTIHSTLLRCFAPRQGRTRILGGRAPAAHTPRHADVLAAKYDGWRGLSGAHGAPHRWRYYYYCRLTARDISLGTVLFHLRLQGCGAPARVTAPRFGVPPLNQWRQARADAPDLTWRQLPAPAAAPPSAPWTASLASLSSSRARAGAAASWARYR